MRFLVGKKYKVTWLDILSFSEWKSKEELLKSKPAKIEATYLYVGRGENWLIFAGETDGTDFGNTSIIPKGCILKATLIK